MDNIVLYDGDCILCSRTVSLLLKYEKAPTLKFARLGSEVLGQLEIPDDVGDSILLYSDGEVMHQSTAVFRIAEHLRSPWRWVRIFRILPTRFTDWVYRFVARNRYRWFGKVDDVCVLSDGLGDRYVG